MAQEARTTLESGAAWLGVSRAQFANYLAGKHEIPASVALLVSAIEMLPLARLERYSQMAAE